MKTIELDVVGGEGFTSFMDGAQSKGLNPTVKQWSGPGGGNPLVTLTGSSEDLKGFLTSEHYGADEEDAAFLVDGVPA